MVELIDNNIKILETRIEESTILKIIEGLSIKNRDYSYISLLRAICICDGHPIRFNQSLIT